ncbi:MAG: RNA-directed DNA polymerase, partial [Candidatus Muirbacterium halophilum]|nr:RNA-directed DNA polymerase [Candidatus Muirbacterium halophilum]
MNNKVKINLKDKYRILITELLPYELPLWFSNENFYNINNNFKDKLDEIINNIKINNYIPLDYKINRTNGNARILSIMHPCVQLKFCDFYEKYQDLILYYCNRSTKSLRFPINISNSFYKKLCYPNTKIQSGIEEEEKNYLNFISFFKYSKFPFLYKFFESYEYNKLEKRYKTQLQIDVSKCFHNLYTHSISWAIKNKFISKRDRCKKVVGFDKDFDDLMQKSNYCETNGILIGPEISRIFAEMIFQRIDKNIIKNLEKKKILIGKDFDFRRYVDDYFVYFNDSKLKQTIIESINSELFEYKLHLNDAKTVIYDRPFITNISLCKTEISKFFEDLFDKRFSKKENDNI